MVSVFKHNGKVVPAIINRIHTALVVEGVTVDRCVVLKRSLKLYTYGNVNGGLHNRIEKILEDAGT